MEEKLNEGLALAAARTGLDLRLNFGSPREGWSRSTVAWNRNEVIVDVNLRERPYLETKREKPVTPYSDLEESDVTVDVISLREILGNKWYMLGDRDEPRDLFDVWSALRRRVPFADVASGHKAKYGYSPSDGVLGRLPRLKDLWEVRLTHQVADLPPFVEVVENITSWFRAWSESRQGA